MQRPVRLKSDEEEKCYFCTTPLPEKGKDGIVWYRGKTGMRWETIPVCELCWRVAEEVRGWYDSPHSYAESRHRSD